MDKDFIINLYKKQFNVICLYLVKSGCKINDAKILEVVVYGTKEELIELINNPLIKATSFGVITDPIY